MRLFAKYNRVNLLATIGIFLLSSIAFYFVIRFILIEQVDNDLRIEEREIETYIKEHGILPESISVKDQKITFQVTDVLLGKKKLQTVNASDAADNDSYRMLQFGVAANNHKYVVTVAKSLETTDDLFQSILFISLCTILLILAASFIMNRVLMKRLWRPFYASLALIKDFRVDKKQQLTFPPVKIDEFSAMNHTLEMTTSQAQQEYSLLKEFTENASHEMQTPLAIIRSKLDLLIQDEHLSEEQSKTMQSAYGAIEKLSRLNQSLLLLAKIENNQYGEVTMIDLKEKIREKLESFHELWQNQHITISSSLERTTVKLNAELADILLNNLLSNATRHNFSNGFIRISLQAKQLEITNSSLEKELDTQKMFARFFRSHEKNHYTGLGLSIIRQICDVSGFEMTYGFSPGEHRFSISW